MQRIKDEGQDPSKPIFLNHGTSPQNPPERVKKPGTVTVSMKNPAVKRSITVEEVRAHNTKDRPWFVVDEEVGFAFNQCLTAAKYRRSRFMMGPISSKNTLEVHIRSLLLLGKMLQKTSSRSIVQTQGNN